jgi:hypothetical protein
MTMSRRNDIYAVLAIFIMIGLGFGVVYLHVNGLIDAVLALILVALPGAVIAAGLWLAVRAGNEQSY